jgi:uncharacterized membrane protein
LIVRPATEVVVISATVEHRFSGAVLIKSRRNPTAAEAALSAAFPDGLKAVPFE